MTLEIGFNPLIKLYRILWSKMGCCCSKDSHLITQHVEISEDRPIDHIKNRIDHLDTGNEALFKSFMDEIIWILDGNCDNYPVGLFDKQFNSGENLISKSKINENHIVLELPLITEQEYISPKEIPRSVLICFVFSIIVLRIRQTKMDTTKSNSKLNSSIPDIFNETLHPFSDYDPKFEDNFNCIDIETTSIYEFIYHLITYTKFPFEFIIMALIYIERGIRRCGINIFSRTNWRRYTLICVLVALKVWDDLGVWNNDYNQFLGINLEHLNKLESTFLNIIDFNLDIPFSVYINYYFAFQDISKLLRIVIPLELQDMNRFACLNKKRSIYAKKLTSTHSKQYNTIS